MTEIINIGDKRRFGVFTEDWDILSELWEEGEVIRESPADPDDEYEPDDPILGLKAPQITIYALELIRADPNVSAHTLEKIMKSDRHLFNRAEYAEYRYLLEEHDPEEVYSRHFDECTTCGSAHIALLIKYRPESDYAHLIAQYAYDRKIPFLAGAILLKDYMKVKHAFYRYVEVGPYGMKKLVPWYPVPARVLPPVSTEKLAKAGYETCLGINDRYTIQAYIDAGGRISMAAELLGVARNTVVSRLRKCGFFVNGNVPPENIGEWLAGTELRSAGTVQDFAGFPVIPVNEQKARETSNGIDIPILDLAVSYFRNGKDEVLTADRNNIPVNFILNGLVPRLKDPEKGLTTLAFAAAQIVGESSEERCAAILGITPDWYRKKMANEHKAFRESVTGIRNEPGAA